MTLNRIDNFLLSLPKGSSLQYSESCILSVSCCFSSCIACLPKKLLLNSHNPTLYSLRRYHRRNSSPIHSFCVLHLFLSLVPLFPFLPALAVEFCCPADTPSLFINYQYFQERRIKKAAVKAARISRNLLFKQLHLHFYSPFTPRTPFASCIEPVPDARFVSSIIDRSAVFAHSLAPAESLARSGFHSDSANTHNSSPFNQVSPVFQAESPDPGGMLTLAHASLPSNRPRGQSCCVQ